MNDERFGLADVIREMSYTAIAAGTTIPKWRCALEEVQAEVARLKTELAALQQREATAYLVGGTLTAVGERELQAEIARLRERDAQWAAAAILLSDVAANCEDAYNDVLPGVCSWHKCAHGSMAACLRAWACAPESLEEETP